MKTIICIIALSTLIFAQTKPEPDPCGLFVASNYDNMTGKTTFQARTPIVLSTDQGRTGIIIHMLKMSSSPIALEFYTAGGGPCMEEDAKLIFLFADEQRMATHGTNFFNCDARASFFLEGGDLIKLQTVPLKAMRVYTLKSSVDGAFAKVDAEAFMKALNCLDAAGEKAKTGPSRTAVLQ